MNFDDFVFAGGFEEGIRQIGNCVPLLFMMAVAGHVCRKILGRVNLHPEPFVKPVSVREAIGKDGWIQYRRDYRKGSTLWYRAKFDKPRSNRPGRCTAF
jgi:hypothetical protein